MEGAKHSHYSFNIMTNQVEIALNFSVLIQSYCVIPSKAAIDSVFKCTRPIPISLDEYSARLGTFFHCSEASFVAAAVLAERLHNKFPGLFCERSAHKIMSAAAIVGTKFCDDKYFSNSYYAECAGVTLQEMNYLESTLLKMLDYRVFVATEDYNCMKMRLDDLAALDITPAAVTALTEEVAKSTLSTASVAKTCDELWTACDDIVSTCASDVLSACAFVVSSVVVVG